MISQIIYCIQGYDIVHTLDVFILTSCFHVYTVVYISNFGQHL